MSYELQFKKKALKEWNKLSPSIQTEFLNILERRLETPRIPKHSLRGDFDLYKWLWGRYHFPALHPVQLFHPNVRFATVPYLLQSTFWNAAFSFV